MKRSKSVTFEPVKTRLRTRSYSPRLHGRPPLQEVRVAHAKHSSQVQAYTTHLHSRKDSLYVDSRKKPHSVARHAPKARSLRGMAEFTKNLGPNTKFIRKYQNINCVAKALVRDPQARLGPPLC